MHPQTLEKQVAKHQQNSVPTKRGRPTLLSQSVIDHLIEIAKLHDDMSEGLKRTQMISKIIKVSGGNLTVEQATNMWQHTIHPIGLYIV